MSSIIMLMCTTGILSSGDGFSAAIYSFEITQYRIFHVCVCGGSGVRRRPLEESSQRDLASLNARKLSQMAAKLI